MPENHDKPLDHPGDKPAHFPGHQYYSELIRIISMMFVGVLALMTFLLTVGFQRPHADFSWALYTAIISLGLNLVAYVVAHMFYVECKMQRPELGAVADKKDQDSRPSSPSKWDRARRRLRVMRALQQVLFVIAVVAVTWLALSTAHFFFTIPPTAPAAGGAPTQ